MKSFRRVYLRAASSGRKASWRAEIFDEGHHEYRYFTLFPSNDPRFRNPSGGTSEELRVAWERVASGKRPTKRHAVLRAHELYKELKQKAGQLEDRLTLRGLAEIEKNHTGKRKRRQVRTMNSIRRVLDRFVGFMEDGYPRVDLPEIKAPHIHDYLRLRRDEGASVATQRNELSYIRRMFQLAVEREDLDRNPCMNVRIAGKSLEEQREAVRKYALALEEQESLLSACQEPYRVQALCGRGGEKVLLEWEELPPRYLFPFVLTALRTGARRGELLRTMVKEEATGRVFEREGLRWSEVDWEQHLVVVNGKTGPREVAMTSDVELALQRLRKEQLEAGSYGGQVFLADNGEPVQDPGRAFAAAVKRAGIKRHVRIHDLRHTCFTNLDHAGVPRSVIQRQAGHSCDVTTAKYIHTETDLMVREIRRSESALLKRRRPPRQDCFD